MTGPIDLRSDTVTRPSEAMRRAMAHAEVGDDVYGEDPSVRALEERAAELLGTEGSLFVPSGTMANQIALLVHVRPGDEVIIGRGAHLFYYEGGAGAAWAGAQFVEVGETGLFTAAEAEAVIKPRGFGLPRTRLVAVENTHNRAGGRVFPAAEFAAIVALCRARGLGLHVDGARLWNAAAAARQSPAALTRGADTVAACFSKGLGAPVGSVLGGSRAALEDARRFRRMFGGAMRQAGVLAAAALFALDQNLARLEEDHHHARRLAQGLAALPGVSVDVAAVETNIVHVDLGRLEADEAAALLAREGVLVNPVGPRRLRAVTHLDVSAKDITNAVEIASRVLA